MLGLLLCGLLSEAVQALLDRGVQGGGRVDRHTWGTNAGFPAASQMTQGCHVDPNSGTHLWLLGCLLSDSPTVARALCSVVRLPPAVCLPSGPRCCS